MTHNLNLHSVYDHNCDEPTMNPLREVTTHHDRVNETVDYMFYEREPHGPEDVDQSTVVRVDHRGRQGDTRDITSSHPHPHHPHQSSSQHRHPSQHYHASNPHDHTPSFQHPPPHHPSPVDSQHYTSMYINAKLSLMTAEEMEQFGAMPNDRCSSDHLMIAAEFIVK